MCLVNKDGTVKTWHNQFLFHLKRLVECKKGIFDNFKEINGVGDENLTLVAPSVALWE